MAGIPPAPAKVLRVAMQDPDGPEALTVANVLWRAYLDSGRLHTATVVVASRPHLPLGSWTFSILDVEVIPERKRWRVTVARNDIITTKEGKRDRYFDSLWIIEEGARTRSDEVRASWREACYEYGLPCPRAARNAALDRLAAREGVVKRHGFLEGVRRADDGDYEAALQSIRDAGLTGEQAVPRERPDGREQLPEPQAVAGRREGGRQEGP